MTDTQVMAALEPTQVDIAPCHFCDTPLSFSSGKHNKVGRCDTEGCWMHDRKMTVPVDDAVQIAQWNRARHRIASSPAAEPVAWLHTLHMELGQTSVRLLEWDGVDPDEPQRTGFGFPGHDYSATYSVTVTPLYATPLPPPAVDAEGR